MTNRLLTALLITLSLALTACPDTYRKDRAPTTPRRPIDQPLERSPNHQRKPLTDPTYPGTP